jgi:hypothetical protein
MIKAYDFYYIFRHGHNYQGLELYALRTNEICTYICAKQCLNIQHCAAQ